MPHLGSQLSSEVWWAFVVKFHGRLWQSAGGRGPRAGTIRWIRWTTICFRNLLVSVCGVSMTKNGSRAFKIRITNIQAKFYQKSSWGFLMKMMAGYRK